MYYSDTVEDSRQYLRLALELIGKHGLPTDPLNYCVWYEYAAGKNDCLNNAIDNCFGKNDTLTEETTRKIFNQCVAGSEQKVTALLRDQLKTIFCEIISKIKSTDQHYTQSHDNLSRIDQSLVPSLSEEDVQLIVGKIKQEISSLQSTNEIFKDQLQQARHEIDELKKKLTHYRAEALKDPLTRIANRRGFEKRLSDAINHVKTAGTSLCLIMADIDHFKLINDAHGHLVGDNVLRMVAATIKESVKGRDLVARIGGEEFAVLLPNTPMDGAMKLANDMRLSFEGLDLKKRNTGESLGKITLSFGVTTYQPNEDSKDFVNRADGALYKSKKTGRNKVTGF